MRLPVGDRQDADRRRIPLDAEHQYAVRRIQDRRCAAQSDEALQEEEAPDDPMGSSVDRGAAVPDDPTHSGGGLGAAARDEQQGDGHLGRAELRCPARAPIRERVHAVLRALARGLRHAQVRAPAPEPARARVSRDSKRPNPSTSAEPVASGRSRVPSQARRLRRSGRSESHLLRPSERQLSWRLPFSQAPSSQAPHRQMLRHHRRHRPSWLLPSSQAPSLPPWVLRAAVRERVREPWPCARASVRMPRRGWTGGSSPPR